MLAGTPRITGGTGGGGGSVTIGNPVVGGNPKSVLFIDNSGNLAQSAGFLYDETNGNLVLDSTNFNNFIGYNAASGATGSPTYSNFIGYGAGQSSNNGAYSQFIGNGAGAYSGNATQSVFIGFSAGIAAGGGVSGGGGANNSIFIGANSGGASADNLLDNSTSGYTSILIGDNTSTGGFSNSIAIGANTVNTASNQFLLGSGTVAANYIGQLSLGDWGSIVNGTSYVLNDPATTHTFTSNGAFTFRNSSGYRFIHAASGGLPDVYIGDIDDWDEGINFGVSDTSYRFEFNNSLNFLIGGLVYSVPTAYGGTGYVLTNSDGAGTLTWAPAGSGGTVYPANQAVFGDGSTAGGVTSANFTFDTSTNAFQVGSGNAILLVNPAGNIIQSQATAVSFLDPTGTYSSMTVGINGFVEAGDISNHVNGSLFRVQDSTQTLSWNKPKMTLNTVPYSWPSSQGGASSVLTNNGSGTLTWNAFAASPIVIGTSGSSLVSTGLGSITSSAANAVFLGVQPGNFSNGATNSIFIGFETGYNSTNSSNSVFIGYQAGVNAGRGTGGATGNQSEFIGYLAGGNTTRANNSIFIGYQAGNNDTVDNSTVAGTSILIGDNTSTGGFSNSIAIGSTATNTKASQFLISSLIKSVVLPGAIVTVPQYAVPTNGSTVTSNGSTQLILNPGGTILGCTIVLPSSPQDGQQFWVTSTQTIGTVTWSGGSILGTPTGISLGLPQRYVYSASAGGFWILN